MSYSDHFKKYSSHYSALSINITYTESIITYGNYADGSYFMVISGDYIKNWSELEDDIKSFITIFNSILVNAECCIQFIKPKSSENYYLLNHNGNLNIVSNLNMAFYQIKNDHFTLWNRLFKDESKI